MDYSKAKAKQNNKKYEVLTKSFIIAFFYEAP